jgi:hypothetical protein
LLTISFNEKCIYLDLTKLDSEKIKVSSKGNNYKKGIRRFKRPCIVKKEWIYECPKNCPLFKSE